MSCKLTGREARVLAEIKQAIEVCDQSSQPEAGAQEDQEEEGSGPDHKEE